MRSQHSLLCITLQSVADMAESANNLSHYRLSFTVPLTAALTLPLIMTFNAP